MDAGLVLFYYTMIILLASILTAATCFASYLVSRSKTLLFAFLGFLFYFFDVALVFQDDFLLQRAAEFTATPFFIGSPVASIVIGAGTLVSFWLLLCEYLDEHRKGIRWVPGVVFIVSSAVILVLLAPGNVEEFLFYSMREAMMYWMLIYTAVTYAVTRDEVKRIRMKRHRRFYVILVILVTCVLFENILFLLIIDPNIPAGSPLPFFPQRNFAENMLVIACAVVACAGSWKNLTLRHDDPPTQGGQSLETFINQNIVAYGRARQLSVREGEVLHFVLLGKDNQNIATALHLAPGTVKVHVHHILQKTSCANRKELVQDFWEFS